MTILTMAMLAVAELTALPHRMDPQCWDALLSAKNKEEERSGLPNAAHCPVCRAWQGGECRARTKRWYELTAAQLVTGLLGFIFQSRRCTCASLTVASTLTLTLTRTRTHARTRARTRARACAPARALNQRRGDGLRRGHGARGCLRPATLQARRVSGRHPIYIYVYPCPPMTADWQTPCSPRALWGWRAVPWFRGARVPYSCGWLALLTTPESPTSHIHTVV